VPEHFGGLGLQPIGRFCGDELDDLKFKYEACDSTGKLYGPSELDRKICRLVSNHYVDVKFKCEAVDAEVDVRGAWSKLNVEKMDRFYKTQSQALSESWYGNWLAVERPSQRAASKYLDLLGYYLPHSGVFPEEGDSILALRNNERQWANLVRKSHRYRIDAFEYIQTGLSGDRGQVLISSA